MEEARTRLQVDDKRILFQSLLAMVERLLLLNEFPVDQDDFALSMQSPEVEDAWRLLRSERQGSLAPVMDTYFKTPYPDANGDPVLFQLHQYPQSDKKPRVFMPVSKNAAPFLDCARRHQKEVMIWCKRQLRLEEQLLRAAKVLKETVIACNTVGQYKRVSPDLLTFLPEKYRLGLKDYEKQSPYPQMETSEEEIETTMATLAYAALQPEHYSEEDFSRRGGWTRARYNLSPFPRTNSYLGKPVRSLGV